MSTVLSYVAILSKRVLCMYNMKSYCDWFSEQVSCWPVTDEGLNLFTVSRERSSNRTRPYS